jgi:chaperone modulatory protein CbpM
MTTIYYREILCDDCTDSEIMDDQLSFTLTQFAETCGQSPEWILQLLEYDILPTRSDTAEHVF